MRRSLRVTVATTAIGASALVLLAVGGILGRTPDPELPVSTVDQPVSAATRLDQAIAQDQTRLRRLPGDWQTWAALSLAYLEKARITADPTWYPKSDDAAARSLAVRPTGNTDALVAKGALANARHDFAAARDLARSAIAADGYDADAYAVLTDAQTQLGDRAAATAAVQQLLDLRPGLSAYARASYDLELRGLTPQATDLMSRALTDAVDPADIAFCRNQLGDLALASGDIAGARTQYQAGLAADPDSVPLQHGLARVDAATGQLDRAIDAYAGLTRRAPTPTYLIEYADLLQAAGRGGEAKAQLGLAAAAQRLFTASGGIDGLTGAVLAEANGDVTAALAQARMEWNRRQHADVADTYAWALHLSHQDSAALALETRALAGGARPAGYLYHLGMIELALGHRVAAQADLGEALRMNPAFSALGAIDARRALAGLEP
jgi:tetratricopeptide (TPR) repeat protein